MICAVIYTQARPRAPACGRLRTGCASLPPLPNGRSPTGGGLVFAAALAQLNVELPAIPGPDGRPAAAASRQNAQRDEGAVGYGPALAAASFAANADRRSQLFWP